MTTYATTVASPVGELTLVADRSGTLTGLRLPDARHRPPDDPAWIRDRAPFRAAVEQLGAYFAGDRRDFDLELSPAGTEFQLAVWQELRAIPYGRTASYGELAGRIGRPRAVRAVGLANGRNPIAVIVPCHRVIGADGSLTGYGGGLPTKRHLLQLEGATAAPGLPL